MKRLPLLLLLLAAPAQAFDGEIVFTRFGGVYQQPADPAGKAVQIAELPDDATEVRWAEPIESGHLIVFDLAAYPVWVYAPDPTKPALLRGGPCTGRARPSPGGACVVCPTRDGPTLVSAGPNDIQAKLPGPLADASFLGPSGLELAGMTDDGILAFDRRSPTERRVVAKAGARSHLLFSPDGKKGVAVFGAGDDARVKAFLLDGEGVPRQLGGPGYPVAWSWDSTWVIFEEGDIKDAPDDEDEDGAGSAFLLQAPRGRPRKKPHKGKPKAVEKSSGPLLRACVARSTGGEVKCWEGYEAQAFSPDSQHVLLKRDKSLYVGKIAGVRPEPPQKILDGADGAATWVPGPIAAPLPAGTPGTGP